MKSNEKQIDEAMRRLDADPHLASEFDQMRSRDYPNASRRKACELGLAALVAHRRATAATTTAKSLRTVASKAAGAFKSAVAAVTRPDRRQGDLPIDKWHVQHVMQAAEKGDPQAIAEINRRGYEINANQTFRKKN